MDLKAVREEAIEATTRSFWDKSGFVPDEDSEEWEEEYRRQFEQARKRHAAGGANQVKPVAAAAADELRRQVDEAGITVEGLIELIDIAERLPVLPIKAKLAELAFEARNLRVFETDDPAVLMVLEKAGTSRSDYAIERDEGLVADLRLYARALQPS